MTDKPIDAELLWTISFINTYCEESNKDHPCNSHRYIGMIKDLCDVISKKYILKDGKVTEV